MTILILIAAAATVRADAISDWNVIALSTVGTNRPGPSGLLDVAVVNAAMYDAVQAIEKDYDPYYVDIPNASGSPIAAAAKAAHDVLAQRFPGQAIALGTIYDNYLIANGIAANNPGVAVGAAAAAGIIALRACDGAFPNPAPTPFVGGTGIGQWRPTPTALSPMNPGPWLGQVTPFLVNRPSHFRSPPPPPVNSVKYARHYNEVKEYGSATSTSRTADQTDMAMFWSGNFVAMMNRVVRDLAAANVNNISDSSRLFAMVLLSNADSMITVWNDKAHYNFWRPITAIQLGDSDGNPRTEGLATWTPLIANPPYPDYSSGANGLTGSTMQALRNFFGTDHKNFSVVTTVGGLSQGTRHFTRFSDAAQEVVEARILLGIHFRFADEASRNLGERIADYANTHYFRPVQNRIEVN